ITQSNPADGALLTVAPAASFTFTVTGDNEGRPDFSGSNFASNLFSNVTPLAHPSISNAAILGIFSGTGDITLDLSAVGSFQVTPGGNLATLTFTQGVARGVITYFYEAVPAAKAVVPH
ncbi:MAG: choice-of-anchor E domain-containing protein, partial [Bryobacterales bacterium]|nr:choice-of-anchor E domain-containing protein [Bryobacterales bacterium]